jgi:predicted outer membrane repeat protein
MSARQRKKRDERRRIAADRAAVKRRIVAGTGLGVAAALGAAGTAQAANFTVNSTAEPGDGTCDPSPGECTLRDALDDAAANNNPGVVDQILFDSSVTGTITLGGTQLPTIDEPLYVDGPGPDTLNVFGDNDSRILYLDTPDGTDVTVSGLRLTGGGDEVFGGAIYNLAADLTVQGATITGNTAYGYGGGITSGGTLTIEGSRIAANSVRYFGGAIFAAGDVTIQNSTIAGNTANGKYSIGAGVVATDDESDVLVEDTTIAGNSASGSIAAIGGGILSIAGTTTIERSTISGNSAQGEESAYGGGVVSKYESGNTTIQRSTISNNSASSGAGGVGVSGQTTIESSTISGNDAASGDGGGVYSFDGDPEPVISNTIVADNGAGGSGPDLFSPSDTFQVAFSLIEDPAGAPINPAVPGSNLTGVDPQLGPLADNGGPTRTRALPAGSPAVDMGSSPLNADQRGLLRPVNNSAPNAAAVGGNCADIGAFELQLGGGGAGPACEPTDANAPETTITKGPKNKQKLKGNKKRKKATFEFTATDARAVAGFECSLDGSPFAPCTSPRKEKVKKGKHEFEVRAVDAAGNVDPTPATDDWKVKKKKK